MLLLALAEDGVALNKIGNEFGISHQRASQIIRKLGISVRDLRQRQSNREEREQQKIIASVQSWISEHPGCRISEVSIALKIPESEVQKLCPQATRGLMLDMRMKKDSEKYRTYPKNQILDALRQAFELRNPSMSMYSVSETVPLSGPYYEKLRNENAVHGPSQARILQIFGTWKEACEEAGVPSVDAVREVYELRWTDAELIQQLSEFITTSESQSATSFDTWCRLSDSRASLGTIRNQIGEWSKSYELALLLLRQTWTTS